MRWNGLPENEFCHFQEKVSRLDRIVAEHNQFSLGIKELQDWMSDAVHMLDSYCHPISDKSVLDSRMLKLEVGVFREMHLIYGICLSQNFSPLHLFGVIMSHCVHKKSRNAQWVWPCLQRVALPKHPWIIWAQTYSLLSTLQNLNSNSNQTWLLLWYS